MTKPATPTPRQVATDPALFARHLLKIQDKAMQTRRLEYNGLQHAYLADRTPRDLILKPRQIGFTTCIQAELRRYEWTRPVSTLTLGKDDENTKEIRRIADFFYDSLPTGFRPQRLYSNATLATYPGISSRASIITAGSRDAARGGTKTHIHGSEVAYWPDAQRIITGALQSGSPQWIVLESTPNGAQGWFYETCMAALDGHPIWRLHFYTWFDYAEYRLPLDDGEHLTYSADELALVEKHHLSVEQIKWRRFKIAEIGRIEDFLQEYPEDVISCFKRSGSGYFGDVDFAFILDASTPTYDPSRRYVAGLDFGQQNDYTALVIIDTTTRHQVALLRINKLPWAEIRKRIRSLCKKWDVALIIAETNSMGGGQIEALIEEFSADQLRTTFKRFDMTAVSKPPLMASLYGALHEGGLRLFDDDIMRHEFRAAQAKQTARGWTIESPRDREGGHGDSVIATALAWHAVSFV